MIDFKNLQLVVNDRYAFVGIERCGDRLRFCLPKGFSDSLKMLQTFEAKRDLFFRFYQILDKFKQICIKKDNLEYKTSDRDGVIKSSQGSGMSEASEIDEGENIFYGKLKTIEAILEAEDELEILSLVYRLGKVERIDYSKLHKFLHRAVFLPNNIAYIDYMDLPRKQVQFTATDIVAMYCYLLNEIKIQLQQEVRSEIKTLAEKFQQKYIGGNYGLFEEYFYVTTMDSLKDALDLIDRNTPIKDPDYWKFYEAIYIFLYGDIQYADDGEIWGIKNFHAVWESMCLTYLAKGTQPSHLLYLDTKFVSDNIVQSFKSASKAIDLSKTFFVNGSTLRPDAILLAPISNIIKDRIYKIRQNNWDDYYYRTRVSIVGQRNLISVACMKPIQPMREHTFKWLRQFYGNRDTILVIDRPLPQQFCSFWEIFYDDLDIEEIHEMYYFNHIFLLGLEKGIVCCNNFPQDVLKPLGISQREPIITRSLFRGYDWRELREDYNAFVKKIYGVILDGIKAIDVKYFDISYYLSPHNKEEIKRRSVRKQFVYEYLIQKTLKAKSSHLEDFKIQSEFWLPGYALNTLIKDGPTFMDGYIDLKQVDFLTLAESYLD